MLVLTCDAASPDVKRSVFSRAGFIRFYYPLHAEKADMEPAIGPVQEEHRHFAATHSSESD
jgi:hypothetical protein